MSFFEFPQTRTYDSDLGWLIWAMKKLIGDMTEFTDINSIKFGDPINWNIATQYEPTTIVVDDEGNGYISRKAVPAGIALTDTEYWTRIFNFSDITDTIRRGIAVNAGDSATAPVALNENDLVWWNGNIYKVLYDIAAGTAFIDGANVIPYTVNNRIQEVGANIGNLENAIAAEATTRENAIAAEATARENAIATEATARENAIAAEATARENAIAAEATARENADQALQDAIDSIDVTIKDEPVNIRLLGGKNDGSEDVGAIINQYTSQYSIYLPAGKYLVTTPIHLIRGLFGCADALENITQSPYGIVDGITNIISGLTNSNDYVITTAETTQNTEISNLNIIMNGDEGGIKQSGAPRSRGYIRNVVINELGSARGISIEPASPTSQSVEMTNVYIRGISGVLKTGIGIYFSSNSSDNLLSNIVIKYIQQGIVADNGLTYISNTHIYCGNSAAVTQDTDGSWSRNARCIRLLNNATLNVSNGYFDTCYMAIDARKKGVANLTNITCYDDNALNNQGGSYFYKADNSFKYNIKNVEIDNKNKLGFIYTQSMDDISGMLMYNNESLNDNNRLQLPCYPLIKDRHYEIGAADYGITPGDYAEVFTFGYAGGACGTAIISDNSGNVCELAFGSGSPNLQKRTIRGNCDLWYKWDGYTAHVYAPFGAAASRVSIEITSASAQNMFILNYGCLRKRDYSLSPIAKQTGTSGLQAVQEV